MSLHISFLPWDVSGPPHTSAIHAITWPEKCWCLMDRWDLLPRQGKNLTILVLTLMHADCEGKLLLKGRAGFKPPCINSLYTQNTSSYICIS